MTFTKEHPRPGPGRAKGSKDKKGARAVAAQVREAVMRTGLTPLQFFAEIYQDVTRPLMERLDAAKAAAPYLHQRMPQKIDLDGEITFIPPLLPRRSVAVAVDYPDEAESLPPIAASLVLSSPTRVGPERCLPQGKPPATGVSRCPI